MSCGWGRGKGLIRLLFLCKREDLAWRPLVKFSTEDFFVLGDVEQTARLHKISESKLYGRLANNDDASNMTWMNGGDFDDFPISRKSWAQGEVFEIIADSNGIVTNEETSDLPRSVNWL